MISFYFSHKKVKTDKNNMGYLWKTICINYYKIEAIILLILSSFFFIFLIGVLKKISISSIFDIWHILIFRHLYYKDILLN